MAVPSSFVAPKPPEGWVQVPTHLRTVSMLREWGFPCASAASEHETFKGHDRGAMATRAMFAGWTRHSEPGEAEAHAEAVRAKREARRAAEPEMVRSLVAELEAAGQVVR